MIRRLYAARRELGDVVYTLLRILVCVGVIAGLITSIIRNAREYDLVMIIPRRGAATSPRGCPDRRRRIAGTIKRWRAKVRWGERAIALLMASETDGEGLAWLDGDRVLRSADSSERELVVDGLGDLERCAARAHGEARRDVIARWP